MRSTADTTRASRVRKRDQSGKRVSRAATPRELSGAERSPRRSPLQTASRANELAEQLRRLEPRRRDDEALDGDYRQAVADGAVEDARRSLECRIRAHMPKASLTVTFTDNRYTMISVRREPKDRAYQLRVHHMFSDADPAITRALARYICHNDARASRLLGNYIDSHQHRVRPRRTRARIRVDTDGRCFDLQELFDDLNARYFGDSIDARISWGARSRRKKRRNSIKMGSYSVEDRLIRIHRTLDRDFVPRYFVEWIVYHEMLHQVHDAPLVNGRRQFHTRAFLEDEARFERYPEARAWERANLDQLLDF